MGLAGWILIVAGIVWSFVKVGVELQTAKKPVTTPPADPNKPGAEGITVPIKEITELAKSSYGPGIVMILMGAILLAADSGTSLEFGGSVTPSPTP